MDENVKTVRISVDEYFELRQKAEMNAFVLERFGHFEGMLFDFDRRLRELEQGISIQKGGINR